MRNDPLALPVLWTKTETMRNRFPRRVNSDGLTSDPHFARVRPINSKDEPRRLGSARTQQTRQPDDLPVSDREVQRMQRPPSADLEQLQEWIPCTRIPRNGLHLKF